MTKEKSKEDKSIIFSFMKISVAFFLKYCTLLKFQNIIVVVSLSTSGNVLGMPGLLETLGLNNFQNCSFFFQK